MGLLVWTDIGTLLGSDHRKGSGTTKVEPEPSRQIVERWIPLLGQMSAAWFVYKICLPNFELSSEAEISTL